MAEKRINTVTKILILLGEIAVLTKDQVDVDDARSKIIEDRSRMEKGFTDMGMQAYYPVQSFL